eukprot:12167087-Ditylum_brightwellii.AAC.1
MSDMACLMASSSLKDGIGVLCSMSFTVLASTSAAVSGMRDERSSIKIKIAKHIGIGRKFGIDSAIA